jgi:HK97 family phage portal protein
MWYGGLGHQTATGLRVSPESAMRVAAVYACVRVVAETIASLPFIIYRRLPNGGKERATNHPLYNVLHQRPNEWQTSYEFLEMMSGHLELRGNAFARIVSGTNGPATQLIPLHPDRVSIYRLPNGRLKYQVRYYYTAKVEEYPQEQILHLRGLSADGLVGLSTIGVGAETIAVGLAAQEFAARFFQNDATPGGVMIHPKTLTDGAHKRIKGSWREYFTGTNQHGVAILEEGMTYQNIGMTNIDAQLLEARQFSRGDIASIFRVPPHKIGDLSRATFSNIEQQNIEFGTDCIRPRLVRLERRINNDLIDPLDLGDEYFAEFQMDALLRGDLKSRYAAYSIGITAGFLTRAEARTNENLNPIPGLEEPLTPLNLSASPNTADEPPAAPEDATGTGAHRLQQFVDAAAERATRKEVSALRRAMVRVSKVSTFIEQAEEFYSTHAPFVADVMHIQDEAANFYVEMMRTKIRACRTDADIDRAVFEVQNEGPYMLVSLAAGAGRRREIQAVIDQSHSMETTQ